MGDKRFIISHSFGAVPRSILAKMAICGPNLKIGLDKAQVYYAIQKCFYVRFIHGI